MSASLPSKPADPTSSATAPRRRGRSVPSIAGAGAIATPALVVGLFGSGMSAASAATNPATAFTAYQKCLAKHGVKMPTGPGGQGRRQGGYGQGQGGQNGQPPAGGGFHGGANLTAKQQKALKACQSKFPKGFGRGGRNGGGQGGYRQNRNGQNNATTTTAAGNA